MARAYFLRSARLGFGTWRADDLALAMELWGDARVTQLIGGPFTAVQVQDRLAEEIATQTAFGVQYWPLFILAGDVHVGCCGLRPVPGRNGVLELGVHIRFDHWGKGYASEAARSVIDYAFRTMGVSGLFAGHHPGNGASRRLLQRLGFRYTHDAFYGPTGLHHPSYLLSDGESAVAVKEPQGW